MNFLKRINVVLILILFVVPAFSQAELIQEDTKVLDTLDYNGKSIVLYENNVWDYTQSADQIAIDKMLTDTMKIFREYWNNDITFTYSYPDPGPAPDSTFIQLLDGDRKFVLPYYGMITSGFGWRGGRNHKALDIHLERGTPVKAAFDGKVRYAKFNTGGYGYLIIIRHFNGLETYYAHLSRLYVKPNQIVKAGQVIGAGGNTGASWAGCHLHFECRWYDHAFDPLKIIKFDSLCLKTDSVVLRPSDFKISQSHKAYLENGVNGTALSPGSKYSSAEPVKQKVVTNSGASGKVSGNYYYVKKGDTLSAIAVRFKTSVDKLCKLNGIKKTTTLQIGQRVKIR